MIRIIPVDVTIALTLLVKSVVTSSVWPAWGGMGFGFEG